MPSAKKRIPDFKSEDEESRFWAAADSAEYVDWQVRQAEEISESQPSLRTISLWCSPIDAMCRINRCLKSSWLSGWLRNVVRNLVEPGFFHSGF